MRAHVIAITALVLIPTLFIGGWLAARSAAAERAQVEQNLHQKAREITAIVDKEIVSLRNLLTALASSHFLQTDDIAGFYRQAVELSRQIGVQMVLRDPERDLRLLNTAVPLEAPVASDMPPIRLAAEKEVVNSGQPTVSNVFLGPIVNRHLISVLVPVVKNGHTAYVLSAGMSTDQFAEILESSQLGTDRIGAILDRNNAFVARSEKHTQFTGTAARVPAPSDPFGAVRVISRDGTPYYWFYRRSEVSGWVIGAGAPEALLEASSRLALLSYGTAGSLLFFVAMALSYGLSGRIARSFGTLGVDRTPTREEFQVLFESAPNGVLLVDRDGVILLVNTQIETKFGYSRDELIGMPVELLVPEHIRGEHRILRNAFAGAPEARPMAAGRELHGRRKDGSEFPIEIGLNPIGTSAGDVTMATVVDVTARQQNLARLAGAIAERDSLRRRFMQAQEEERLRLAHELHDQTGQSLAAAMLELKGIEANVDESGRSRLRELRRQLDMMGKELHHIAWELRPPAIDELGLESVLTNYVSDWGVKFGIETDFHCAGDLDDLNDEVRTTLYRVVQEALTNIAKHARGTSIASVVIDRSDATLQMTIEDNGKGFEPAVQIDPGYFRSGSGLGLPGMRERLSFIGGELVIESSLGGGTAIFVRIPLERERMPA